MRQKKLHVPIVAPLERFTSSCLGDLVAIDLVHLDTAVGGYEDILTITDHFTRFLQIYPLRNKKVKTVAHHLYFDYVMCFGIPARLFMSKVKNLRINYFILFSHIWQYINIAQHLIILRAVVSANV